MDKKVWIIASLGILLLFVNCNETENRKTTKTKTIETKKKENRKLNFLGHWLDEGLKGKLVKEFVREYEFLHQDVDVNFKFNKELFDNRKGAIQDSFMLRQLRMPVPEWDIIYLSSFQTYEKYLNDPGWAKKYLVDFSQIPEFCKNVRPELLTDSFKNSYGGICPGIFLTKVNWVLWVNTDVAKKANINVKQFDMTFDDFLGYLKAVKDYNLSHNENIYPFLDASDWKTAAGLAYLLFTSKLNNVEELKNGQFSKAKLAALEETLIQLERMSIIKPFPPENENLQWSKINKEILKDKCLFFYNASWMYNIWQMENEVKLKKAIMPVDPPVIGKQIIGFGNYLCDWSVLKNSPNVEQAIQFIVEMTKPYLSMKWTSYTKSLSGLKSTILNSSYGLDQFDTYNQRCEQRFGNKLFEVPYNSYLIFGNQAPAIELHFLEVMQGKMLANDAIVQIRKELKNKGLL